MPGKLPWRKSNKPKRAGFLERRINRADAAFFKAIRAYRRQSRTVKELGRLKENPGSKEIEEMQVSTQMKGVAKAELARARRKLHLWQLVDRAVKSVKREKPKKGRK